MCFDFPPPCVGSVGVHMVGRQKGDQDIDIEQGPRDLIISVEHIFNHLAGDNRPVCGKLRKSIAVNDAAAIRI